MSSGASTRPSCKAKAPRPGAALRKAIGFRRQLFIASSSRGKFCSPNASFICEKSSTTASWSKKSGLSLAGPNCAMRSVAICDKSGVLSHSATNGICALLMSKEFATRLEEMSGWIEKRHGGRWLWLPAGCTGQILLDWVRKRLGSS